MTDPWNSLEITKLVIEALTPIFVVYIGYIINININKIESNKLNNQRIIEKRLEIYDDVVPKLNDILCFHCYIGNWKDISSKEIINLKRMLDKKINIYSPLFDDDLVNKYNLFIKCYYEINNGWGKDAKIKSLYDRREEFSNVWSEEDRLLFSEAYIKSTSINNYENTNISEKKKVYFDLVNCLSSSLEIMKSKVNGNIENPNINFSK